MAALCPRIQHMAEENLNTKEGVQAFLSLVSAARPVSVSVSARLHDDSWNLLNDYVRMMWAASCRSFVWECYEEVKELYTMTGGSCEPDFQQVEYDLSMELRAK